MTDYNGWTNYETWLVSLWLNNEPGSQHDLEQILKSEKLDYTAGKLIREYIEENYQVPTTGLIADLVNAALDSVNWQEIACDNRVEDETETEEEED